MSTPFKQFIRGRSKKILSYLVWLNSIVYIIFEYVRAFPIYT